MFLGLKKNTKKHFSHLGARSAAATELRPSRCCDGAAQTSSVALIQRVAELEVQRRNHLRPDEICIGKLFAGILLALIVVGLDGKNVF